MKTYLNRSLMVAAGSAMLLGVAGCSASHDDENDTTNCQTSVVSASSPAAGALTLTGHFYADESVILRYTVGTETRAAVGTPASDRTAFTLTGLPSGTTSYHILVSCDGGQDDLGTEPYTVK